MATIVAFLVMLMPDSALGEAVRIPITVSDSENHRHTLVFGFHPHATYGFDDTFGEMPIPPVPAVPAFDVRFLDPQRRKQYGGDGAYVDIRAYTSRTQIDTFYVRGQPANQSFPLTFSWPGNLAGHFDHIILAYQEDGSSRKIDMTARTSFTIREPSVSSFMIITSGVKGKNLWKD